MTWQPPRESEFTQPTERCPHPEWWTAENIMATEVEVSKLVAAFVVAVQPEFVVEIGSHYGQTTARIAQALEENGHGEFVSLEIDQGLHESASWRTQQYKKIQLICENSHNYIPPRKIDFLFVDGGLDRLSDVAHFEPYLTERALVIVHDTGHDPYDQQVLPILDILGGNHIQLDTPRGLLIVKRG